MFENMFENNIEKKPEFTERDIDALMMATEDRGINLHESFGTDHIVSLVSKMRQMDVRLDSRVFMR